MATPVSPPALLGIGEALPGARPPGLETVAGITLLERQIRQVRHAGLAEILVLAPALPEALALRLRRTRGLRILPTPEAVGRILAGRAEPCLVLVPGLLVDQRLIRAVLARAPGPVHATFARDPPEGALRLDGGTHDAGVMLLPAPLVARSCARLGDWELMGTLARAAAEAAVPRLVVEDLDTYAPELRRHAPLLWAMPRGDEACRAATRAVLAGAQKGCLDWPARYLHPPLEDALVRLLLPTPVTPNMVTVATAALGLAALVAFALGHPWAGLGLVLLVGPLDGVDGKLARARVEFSRWGDLEHVLDKLLEYGWFLALGGWLAGQGHGVAAWLAAAGIVVLALAEATQGEFFRRFTGRQLDDWGVFERRWRLVAGRRNTFFWSLLPFAVLGAWFEGLLALLGYAAVTFAVGQWRFLLRLAEHGRAVSASVRASFASTSYAFLPKADGGRSGEEAVPHAPSAPDAPGPEVSGLCDGPAGDEHLDRSPARTRERS